MTRPRTILIVSDDAQVESMRSAFSARRFAVSTTTDYESAYRQLLDTQTDLVVVDIAGAATGVEFIKRVRATPNLTQPLLLVVAEWGTGGATLALQQRADAYEPKPIAAARLVDSIERLLGTKALPAKRMSGAE